MMIILIASHLSCALSESLPTAYASVSTVVIRPHLAKVFSPFPSCKEHVSHFFALFKLGISLRNSMRLRIHSRVIVWCANCISFLMIIIYSASVGDCHPPLFLMASAILCCFQRIIISRIFS
uniref:Secreted protein n=1 Tax=Panstrongylus lignarius TaxID=156445 RepID=A0A224Y0C8_9HEMI